MESAHLPQAVVHPNLIIPFCSVFVTASVRSLTSSFWKMLAMCVLTVLSLI
jgi:uncharacterized membrane protein YdbT with pleckstrin-like domain